MGQWFDKYWLTRFKSNYSGLYFPTVILLTISRSCRRFLRGLLSAAVAGCVSRTRSCVSTEDNKCHSTFLPTGGSLTSCYCNGDLCIYDVTWQPPFTERPSVDPTSSSLPSTVTSDGIYRDYAVSTHRHLAINMLIELLLTLYFFVMVEKMKKVIIESIMDYDSAIGDAFVFHKNFIFCSN